MPEYLAPGVYVEETSFRAKSIEGVGTSTTAFVGPTRRGPLATTQRDAAHHPPAPPELLTSFGDFVRIYGGLEDLVLGGQPVPNYIAHGVLNFFNEGGTRLYVTRVASGGLAAQRVLLQDVNGPRVSLVARFPGTLGNGRVVVREILSAANGRALETAAPGTLLQARPAALRSSQVGPYSVANNSALRFSLNGAPATNLNFPGEQVSLRSNAALGANTVLGPATRTVTVDITDEQTIQVPPNPGGNPYSRAAFIRALNAELRLGSARLSSSGELFVAAAGPSQGDELVITTRNFTYPVDVELASAIPAIPNANLPAGFNGASGQVSVRSVNALPANIAVAAGETLTIRIRDRQTVQLPVTPVPGLPAADFLAFISGRLQRATVRLAVAGEQFTAPPAAPAVGAEIVFTTQRRGHGTRLTVTTDIAAGLAFPGGPVSVPQGAGNPFANLDAVLPQEINTALAAIPIGVTASVDATGRLLLRTAVGGNPVPFRTLTVLDAGPNSAHTALGLTADATARGIAGPNSILFQLTGNQWLAEDGLTQLGLPAPLNPTVVFGSFLTVAVLAEDATGADGVFDDLTLAAGTQRYLGTLLGETPPSRREALENMFAFRIAAGVSPFALRSALFAPNPIAAGDSVTGDELTGRTATLSLATAGGSDGNEPNVGDPETPGTYQAALAQLRGLEDISIIAAPGHSAYGDFQGIQRALLAHASLPRAYRVAVLDSRPNQLPSEIREDRGQIDSSRAALYYPWVVVANPLARSGRDDIPRELTLPPSAFLCGIYARNDVEQSVAKAPANEIVRSALRFEVDVNFAQNQLLNPLGVNCLRFFPGRGYRVWGARTVSSDPEFKYLNVRRYFIYLEASIDRSTQWAVFENNGPRLWANITETIESFLYNEWVSGNLLGESVKEAYFVRCDRSTMTQNDLDNGRLICLIGVAVLKPAEFVIFRIGQKTADARS